MSTIVTRSGKGSALTWAEGDANFTNLNNDKLENITLRGDSGTDQAITSNEIITISGGTGLSSVVSSTSTGAATVTVNLDNTAVTPNTYTNATVTVDAQGRITSASSGSSSGITDVVQDTTPQLGGDLDVNTYKLVSTTNGNIELQPNGTGDVYLTADTVRVGDANATATVTTNGTGDLVLNTNSGTNSGSITITQGANGNITVSPNGTGDVYLDADTLRVGDSNANATITTNGTGDLILNTNSGTNSGTITIQDAANGNIILAPNGTGRVEISGTTSNAGGINFYEDADNGTNKALLTAPSALGADITLTLPSTTATLGYLNLPAVGTKTGSYSLGTGDVGKYVQVGSGGSITIPDATFAEGDVIVIANNHTAAITITCTITTAYIAGTDTDKASVSLATRGVANILFLSSTACIISGNVT